jgi:hypothetical protein
VVALTEQLSRFQGDLNGQDIGIGLYGMQGLSSNDAYERDLAQCAATKFENSVTELDSQAIGNS